MDKDDVQPWSNDEPYDYSLVPEVQDDYLRAQKHIKKIARQNNRKVFIGEYKPEPSKGWWFREPVNMTTSGSIAKYMIDEQYPFVPHNDRELRALKRQAVKEALSSTKFGSAVPPSGIIFDMLKDLDDENLGVIASMLDDWLRQREIPEGDIYFMTYQKYESGLVQTPIETYVDPSTVSKDIGMI